MPTSTTVKGLNINELTEAQYDAAVQGGVIGPNELSVLTDVSYVEPSDLATVATTGDYDDLINKPTIPAAIQVSSMPVASVDELDKIYQFVGATDVNYTNGYFYKCVSDGQTPATYSWEQTDVMPAGSSLPSQTGHSGEFLTTDGTDASWSDKPLQNTATQSSSLGIGTTNPVTTYHSVVIGTNATNISGSNIAIGEYAKADGVSAISICPQDSGYTAKDNSIIIGGTLNPQKYQVRVGSTRGSTYEPGYGSIVLGTYQFDNTSNAGDGEVWMCPHTKSGIYDSPHAYKLMDSDGTIPEARLADTTNAAQGQVLTLDSNGDAVWQTPSTAVTSTTATLVVADWAANTQTLTVSGVTSSNVVIVSPQPLSSGDYATAGVLCTAQNTNSLTFTCTQTPSNAIDLSIVIIG